MKQKLASDTYVHHRSEMRRSTILVLSALLCGVNCNCEILRNILNLNPSTTADFPSSSIETSTRSSATQAGSNTVHITSKVTRTSNTNYNTQKVSSDGSDIVDEFNNFAQLYVTLKSYHEVELRKVQTQYELLEAQFRNEFHEIQLRVRILESELRELRLQSRTSNASARSDSDSQTGNNSNSRQDNEVLHKIDQIYQRLSNGCDCNEQLLLKVEQIHEKLFKSMGETPAVGTTFCGTKNAENGNVTSVAHKRYFGCYQDREENRMLKEMLKHFKSNSVDVCIDACRSENFAYAGIEG